jgi:potassium-transporting ATPase KdpC subunit
MNAHLRANLWLVGLTLLICSVLYPLVLLGIGQTVFHDQAQGSLIPGPDGKPIGSRLIAQPFSGDEYFQPRPSAASYNGAASGASNWGASNYLLRHRVARTLGPIVKYRSGEKKGQLVKNDIEEWFKNANARRRAEKKPGLVAEFVDAHGGVAGAWASADDKHKEAIKTWMAKHQEVVTAWKEKNQGEPKEADLAVDYLKDFAATNSDQWPKLIDDATWGVAGVFFDMWLQEHPQADLELVPADMVMASGSGLDPHITLKNALYQLDRVAAKWAEKTKRDGAKLRSEIEAMLRNKATAPLGGFVGVELINVLEMNLALRDRYAAQGGGSK